jgi:hypothetical protein
MLEVQKYLKSKTLDDLKQEFGIKIAEHPNGLPLIILNYDQIESPKTESIVRECRALVLHADSKEIVAKSFNRFFNWGEVQEEQSNFDFSDFIVQSKEDGSLVLLYCFDGQWHANTRGSFALDKIEFQNFSWRDAFCKALAINGLEELKGVLDETVVYVCEFCSPWNKIVRRYDQPQMFLLTAFKGITELTPEEVDGLAGKLFQRPHRYNFCNIEEIQAFLQEQSANDATFEGVVIRDRHGHRWKIKSATYLGLHKLRGEGDNVWNPKHLLPFILTGEEDELLTYFPEIRGTFYEFKAAVLKAYSDLLEVWGDHWQVTDQKEFALLVKDKPFSSILFSVRKKHGTQQRACHLRQEFRENEALILKKLFKHE